MTVCINVTILYSLLHSMKMLYLSRNIWVNIISKIVKLMLCH